jgi:hypothetical protein
VITYAQLLAQLQALSAAELERVAKVSVAGQALAISRVVDGAELLLDTNIVASQRATSPNQNALSLAL